MFVVFGLTTLMFGAGGLQFWTITYMQVALFMDPMEAQSIFVLVLFSSMLPGVAMGSVMADYMGGYKGRGLRHSLTLCCVFGFIAASFSLALSRCFDPEVFVILLWFFFFWGGAIMPIAAGIIVSSVPKFATNSGSAFYCIF